MISFCQDLSISYEYHVYENKTIKKITHSRNGSNFSEKITSKSNKLQVISKNIGLKRLNSMNKGIFITDNSKVLTLSPKNKGRHQRSISNQIEMKVIQTTDPMSKESKVLAKQQLVFPNHDKVEQFQVRQKPLKQRVVFNRPKQTLFINRQQKPSQFSSQSPTLPSYSFIQSTKDHSNQSSPFKTKQNLQTRTVRLDGSVERLDQSIECKNFHLGNFLMSNKSFATSLESYDAAAKFKQDDMIASQEIRVQNIKHKRQLQFDNQKSIFTSRENYCKFQIKRNDLQNPEQKIFQSSNPRLRIFPTKNQTNRIIDKPEQKYLFAQYLKMQANSPLFDAASIVSKTLTNGELDDQSLSVVEQRNFFFQKEEQPNRAFKRSIEKFIFFEAGHVSRHSKWILFRNAQQKQNKKMYSIKEFSSQHEKEYFNEYDIYLSLKTQTLRNYQNKDFKGPNVFLELFSALSNSQDKKLHLVKQHFEYLLGDYIRHLKHKKTLAIDRIKALMHEKQRIQARMKEVMDYFQSKDITIRQSQQIQIEDFVVCQYEYGQDVIKFHSLYKLEKGDKIFRTFTEQPREKCQTLNQQKIDRANEKLHLQFF